MIKNIIVVLILWLFAATVAGRAADFPSRPTLEEMAAAVTEGTVYGDAMRERTLAVNGTQTFLPYCGARYGYMASLQQVLESLAVQYVDDVNGPLNGSGTSFLYFTLAGWRSLAGLNASGFQRYDANRNLTGYGIAQSSNVIVGANFGELGDGCGVLHWTLVTPTSENNQYKGDDFNMAAATWQSTVAAAKAEALAYYNNVTPASNPNAPEAYTTLAAEMVDGEVKYQAAMIRLRRVGIFDWSADARNSLCTEIAAYLKGVAMGTFDNQGDNISETFTEVKAVTFSPGCSVDLFGTWAPVANWPEVPSVGEKEMQGYVTVYKGTITKYLAKWSFSIE